MWCLIYLNVTSHTAGGPLKQKLVIVFHYDGQANVRAAQLLRMYGVNRSNTIRSLCSHQHMENVYIYKKIFYRITSSTCHTL